MKTTIDISDELFLKAKKLALQRKIPLRRVFEESLYYYLSGKAPQENFELEDESVPGNGPGPEFKNADWVKWRSAAYGG